MEASHTCLMRQTRITVHMSVNCLFRQAWKGNSDPMKGVSPSFKKRPAEEDLPKEVKLPELLLCKHADGRLSIPNKKKPLGVFGLPGPWTGVARDASQV